MTRRQDTWIGLDLGTQSARAVAVGSDGRLHGQASRPLSGRRTGLRHEQDPCLWWRAVADACAAVMASVSPETVRGVATCATSGTILLVDADGRPLTPGVMYDDQRAASEAEVVEDAGRALWRRLGYGPMQPTWALPKLVWLLDELGDDAADARLAHQADVVTRALVGGAVPADSSHALKTGYDVVDERWPSEVLEGLGIGPSLLPDVVRSGSVLGAVCARAAEETGLPAGTAVVAGMTDGCAAQIAAGALADGAWNSVLGTTLVVKGATRDRLDDPTGAVYSHRAPDGGWFAGGASSVGAGALSAAFAGRDLSCLDAKAAAGGPTSVLAYPLVSRGERFPFVAPDAQAFVVGDDRDESRRYAALLQGVAFTERLIFDHLARVGAPINDPVALTGGAARSQTWSQMRADVLGRAVVVPRNAEAGVGMAVLAAASVDGRSLAHAAADMVKAGVVREPRFGLTARYQELYGAFVDELTARGWLDAAATDRTPKQAMS